MRQETSQRSTPPGSERDGRIRPRMWLITACLLGVLILIKPTRSDHHLKADPQSQTEVAANSFSSEDDSAGWVDVDQNEPRSPTRIIAGGNSPFEPEPASGSLADEVIAKLKPGTTNIDAIAASAGGQVAGRIDKLSTYRLKFADAEAATLGREQLATDSQVESLDSNYAIARPPAGEEVGNAVGSQAKLNVTAGDSGGKLVVGLVDTAVQVENSGMDENFFLPPISVSGDSSSDATSLTHGTCMAEAILQGLSSGVTGNTTSDVRILSVDVYGQSASTTTYQVAEGIVKAVESGATIINLSLAASGDSSLLQQVITDAHNQGIIFFSAAGNEPVTTATYPAAYPEVVAVTATDENGRIASYANYGDFVDIAAPGTIVVNYNGKSYVSVGTSAATALASGAAARLAEKSGASAATTEKTIREGLAVP